jgi:RNA polymerase sigma-70 factor, ECF subfamily
MLNAAYGVLAMVPVVFGIARLHDGVPMSANSSSPMAEYTSSASDLDAQPRHANDGEVSVRFQTDVIPLLKPLYHHAVRLTGNHIDAEDLVQDTIMKAYAGLRSFEQGTNLQGWLFRIMTNAHIDAYRRQQRRPAEYPISQFNELLLANAAHSWPTGQRPAEEQALDRLGDSEIRAAMQTLPEQFRLAIYYADVEGFGYKEIADLMRTTVGTVLTRLHRGRRLLRRILAETAQQRGYTAAAQPA